MADKEQLAILKQGVDVWNKWREDNPAEEVEVIAFWLASIPGPNVILCAFVCVTSIMEQLTVNPSTKSDNTATVLTFERGEIIFNEGDTADHFFIVAKGEVELLVADRVVGTECVGGIFGEMALVSETVRSATARAKVECRLDAVDHEAFLSLIKQSPEFALHVMRVMADRIRNFDSTLTKKGHL